MKVKTLAYLGVLIHYSHPGLHEAVEHSHVALGVDLVLPKVGVGACVQSHCLPQLLAHIVPLLNGILMINTTKWQHLQANNILLNMVSALYGHPATCLFIEQVPRANLWQ